MKLSEMSYKLYDLLKENWKSSKCDYQYWYKIKRLIDYVGDKDINEISKDDYINLIYMGRNDKLSKNTIHTYSNMLSWLSEKPIIQFNKLYKELMEAKITALL